MKIKQTLTLILILLLGSGCIIIPLPADHFEEIDKVLHLDIGSSTKEEVISILGEPDITLDGAIMYNSREYSGGEN